MDRNNKLIEREKTIINIFKRLLKETGNLSTNVEIFPNGNILGDKIIVDKKDDCWVIYVKERGQITGYEEYDDIYQLCLNVFESLDKASTDYCINIFVPSVQSLVNTEDNKYTRKLN